MGLTRQHKWLLGAFTVAVNVLPVVLFPVFLLSWSRAPFLILFFVLYVGTFGLMVFYIVYAARAGRDGLLGRVVWPWILLLVFGGSIGLVVFWYLNIWALRPGGIGPASPHDDSELEDVARAPETPRCPDCGTPYNPADYRVDAIARCLTCSEELPIGRHA